MGKIHTAFALFVLLFLFSFHDALSQSYNMGNSSISACGGNFYDSGGNGGGAGANYANNENYTFTICSSSPGQCVSLSFTSFSIENNFDFLRIYNGSNTAAPLLGTYTGTTNPGTVTATSGCLTLVFTSDGSVNSSGWAASITCVACPSTTCNTTCNGGTAPANDACGGATNLGQLPIPAACPNGVGTAQITNTTNLCATAEMPYTSLLGCRPSGNMASPASDVWYRFTITGPTLNVNITGLQTPNVGIYSGTNCNNLIPRGCAIGSNGSLSTSFGGLAPGTYYMQVSGGNLNDQCNFTLQLQNNYDCAGCVIVSNLTANPPPVNGTYQAGQRVNFCYTISDYNQTSVNWLHAVIPSFTSGWDMSTLSYTMPANCSGQGNWVWNNGPVTSSATGLTTGAGYYYESALGSPGGTLDGNPGNNYGDNNALNTCDWTFCFSITTLPPNQCIPGAPLNVTVDSYGDGETGSWTSFACSGDPVAQFFAQLACCLPPTVNEFPPPCSNGTGSASVVGQGVAPWNYIWRNSAGTVLQTANGVNGSNTLSNLAPGTYTATVTDDAGCTSMATVNINNPLPVSAAGTVANVSCNGASNGSITVTPTGGTGPYNYSWTPNIGTTATINNLAAGSYSVRVTDANGCTGTQTFTVSQAPPVTATTSSTAVGCFNGNNGSATVTPGGGTGPYSYVWSPTGGSGATANNLPAGSYTVTVTDSRGCTSTASASITQPTQLAAQISSSTNVSCANQTNGSAIASVSGGTPNYTYAWTPSGGSAANGTGMGAGNYTVTVTDSRGCTSTASVVITAPASIVASTSGINNPTCNGALNGSANANASGGTPGYTYNWSPSGGTSSTAANLGAGTYTVTVTDANGCTRSATATLIQPSVLTATTSTVPVNCNGDASGSATANPTGGTGPYSYNWLPSGGTTATESGLLAGAYTVNISDANGCTTTQSVTISQPTPIGYSVSTVPATCGANNGSASLTVSGGNGPYTFAWSPTGGSSSSASNLAAGAYSVTIMDANGCTVTASLGVSNTNAATVAITSSTNVSCSGGNNGSATATVSGGTAPLTYQWSPSGGTTALASGLGAGSYTITVTDGIGCSATANINIGEPSPVNAAISSAADVTCSGGANGSATALASGGTAPYTYSWTPAGGSGSTANNLVAGNYTVTVTDAQGCSSTANTNIIQPAPVTATANAVDITCNGAANGSVSVSAGGGNAPYSYIWSPVGGSGSSASGLAPGSYTVTVTDAAGCSRTATAAVTQPAALIAILNSTNVSCFGQTNGTAGVSVSGGTSPFNYTWSPSGSGSSITGLAAGNYTVTITDGNGCTLSSTATITQPSQLTASISSTADVLCFGGNDGAASVSAAGGSGALGYSWTPSGGTSATATNLPAGNYSVTVTDPNGCTAVLPVTINQPSQLINSITGLTNPLCNGATTGSATASPFGGTAPYTFTWSGSAGSSATATGLQAGSYTVTVTDGNGCTTTSTANITQPSPIFLSTNPTNATCGSANGSASVSASGGTPGYNYSWSPSGGTSSTATGLASGNHSVDVTDANGCLQRATLTIGNSLPPVPVATVISNVACNGGNTGSASISVSQGTAPVSVSWSPSGGTGTTANNLAAGFYTITATDALGCTATQSIVITEPPVLTATIASTDVLCNGNPSGSASIAPTGGTPNYSILWTPGNQAGSSLSSIPAGNYTAVVTDANGCSITTTTTVSQPPLLTLTTSPVAASCAGAADGSVIATAAGGTGTITYSWSPVGGTNASQNGLQAGTYSVTITDANGCTATASTTVSQPQPLTSAVTNSSDVSCFGGSNGSASVNATGGTAGYTYAWAPSGGTGTSASGLVAGSYSVSVTDANGCTSTAYVTINQPTQLAASIPSSSNVLCSGGNTGSATSTASGGTGGYIYSWTPAGGTSQTATGLSAGNYTVVVTDANGCTSSATSIITEPALLTASIASISQVSCNGGSNGSITLNSSGGTPSLSYAWTPAVSAGSTASNIPAGGYNVTITDANGCTVSTSATITQPTAISIATSSADAICGNANGSVSATASGGTPGFNYTWSPGSSIGTTLTGIASGSFTVTATDANGCTATSTATVIARPGPIATASTSTNVSCNGGGDGSVTAAISNGTAPLSINWSPSGGSSSAATGLSAGSYTITVTDANGCTSTSTTVVTEPTPLISSTGSNPVSCNGGSNGNVSVISSGGTSPIQFLWTPGGNTTSSVNNLSAGTYQVTVTDANGCITTNSATISQPTILTAASSSTDASCFGGSNGTATATVNGGTSGYTYSWFPAGGTNPVATGLSAGSYSLTVADANGCQTSTSVIVGEPPAINILTSSTPAICGNANGSANVTASGGTSPFSYSWAPGNGTTASITGQSAGGYNVTVTDANGCSASASATISNIGGPIAAASVTNNVSCNGGNNGAASVSVSSGTPPFSYTWSPVGGSASTASGLSAGNYTVNITDSYGCITSDNVIISQPTSVSVNASSNPVSCNGSLNGSASANATGGTGGFNYTWSPGGISGSTASGLAGGNYTVLATDANGCTASTTITVQQPTPLIVIATPQNVSCNGGNNGSATANASGGNGGFSYSWFPAGGSGSIGSGLSAGAYTVTATDINGCTGTSTVTIQQPAAISMVVSTTDATCGSLNGSATVIASGGAGGFTYSWTSSSSNSSTANNLAGGAYTATVTDANGCTSSALATVSNIGGPTITATVLNNVSCNGGSNGSATVNVPNGTAPFSYSWSPTGGSGAVANGLPAGNFSITVTDANGCISSDNVTIAQPSALAIQTSSMPASCTGSSDGSSTVISVGGTLPYTYSWNNGGGNGSTANNLSAGSYTVTVTDANGCTRTSTSTVSQPTPVVVSTTTTQTTCNGASNGSATAVPTGGTSGYSFSWFPAGGSGATAVGLSAGAYTVTVTDANGCSSTANATISQPPALLLSTSSNPASCGSANGSANVSATGGFSPYTYAWVPSGASTPTASGLLAGSYIVTVTDANGCTNSTTASVSNVGGPNISANVVNNVSCFGGNNGRASVTISNGTAPFQYSWSPLGGNGPNAQNLPAGSYSITITDNNGCVSTDNISITQPGIIVAQATSVNASCFGSSNGSASAIATGGTSPYTYNWSPSGGNGTQANNLAAGSYSVTVTDANGCTVSATTSVTQPQALNATATVNNVTCYGGTNGSINTTVSGGTSGYNYNWFPAGGSGSTAAALTAGNYIVTVTDANGCTSTSSATVSQPAAIVLQTSTTPSTCGSANGSAAVSVSGGATPYSYSWSPVGGNSSTATGLAGGAYTVLVTDNNGCTISTSATVSNAGGPVVVASIVNNVSCSGGSNGTASVTVPSGNGPYSYLWSPGGSTNSTASGLSAGNYTVTVSDINGCISSDAVSITQPTALLAQSSSTAARCFGSSSGASVVVATGGNGPYTYNWTPGGGTTAAISNIPAGSYTVTVTDASGCTTSSTIGVTQPAALTLSTSTLAVRCNGSSNGTATASVSGGTPVFSYSWFPAGGSSATTTGLPSGTYNVTVTDANGCTSSAAAIINQPVALSLMTSTTPASCGSSNGTASVTTSGGLAPYSYSWTGSNSISQTVSGLPAGSYIVTVTDANGCSNTSTANISNIGGPVISALMNQPVTCFGASNGSASVTVNNGTAPYSYSWSPSGGSSSSANNLVAGNYTITVLDANGCASSTQVSVTQPTAVVAQATSIPAVCNGSATGSASVTATGGSGGYTYSWTPGGSTVANPGNMSAGNYIVTVTDASGCSTTSATQITQPAVITLSTSSQPASCNGSSNGTATATAAGGTPAYSYSWFPGGANGPTATGLSAGTYIVTLTDGNGCTTTRAANITQPGPIVVSTTTIPASCGSSNGTASATASGGSSPYSFAWSPTGGFNATAQNLLAGSYTVTVTDQNGCTTTSTAAVSNSGGPTATLANSSNVSCFGQANGSAAISATGGTAPLTYLWTPSGGSGPSASGLGSGSYVVRVTDANGCFSFVNITINEPTPLSLQTSSTPTTCGAANGTADVAVAGGVPGYSYSWTPTGSTSSSIANLNGGSYTVVVTDANGCTVTAISVVGSLGGATASILTSTDPSCSGGNNGSATIQVAGGIGPFTYSWSPVGGTTASASGLSSGIYTVQVTDGSGCVTNVIVPILEPDPISLNTNTTPAACNGGTNGSASVTVLGGTAPYGFSWSPGGMNTPTVNGLGQGIYTVVVTDANGCVETATAQVNSNSGILTTLSTTDILCFGGSNGSASISTQGGSPPYFYSWTPGGYSSNAANNLSAGAYQVIITDATGCSQTQLVVINSPTQLTLSASGASTLCNAQFANLAAQAGGGTTPYSYSWNTGSTDSLITVYPAQSTTYTVSVTDANGCSTANQILPVTVLPPLQVTATGDDTLCAGSSAIVQAQAAGGDGAYLYSWNNGNATGSTLTVQPASDTTYTVTVIDGCGQPVYDQVSIWVRPGPTVEFGPGNVSGCSPVTVSFDDLSNAPSGSTYYWEFGDQQTGTDSDPVHTFTQPGDYSVTLTVTSPGGCTGTYQSPQMVHVEGYPIAGFDQSATDIDLLESQVIFTNTSIYESGSTFSWNFGDGSPWSNDNNPVHSYDQIGTYPVTLIVTTPAGCIDTVYGEVRVAENFAIYIPNAFTPNGDGTNDSFNAFGVGISKYDMYIYDRWGLQLFHSTSITDNWDGSVHENGNPCQNDVYEYVIMVEDMKGKRHKYIGHVSLVR